MSALPTNPQRMPYWDNLKGILIILVVLGHYLWEYRGNQGIQEMAYVIYVFHMPAFILVSGYFSRSGKSTGREALTKILILFLLLNFSMMFYAKYIEHKSFSFVSLYYSSWYLLALFLYRLTLPLCRRIPFIVPISLIASLCIGFFWRIDDFFQLQKIIALYPFFIVGATLTTERMEGSVAFLKRHLWAIWGVLPAVVIFSLWLIHRQSIGLNEVMWLSYNLNVGVAKRFLTLFLACSMVVILLAVTPRVHIPLINKWGRNSLAIYLAHRIFTLLLVLFFPRLGDDALGWFWLSLASFITLAVLGTDRLAGLINRVLDYLVGAMRTGRA